MAPPAEILCKQANLKSAGVEKNTFISYIFKNQPIRPITAPFLRKEMQFLKLSHKKH